jgi:hypothetical protein
MRKSQSLFYDNHATRLVQFVNDDIHFGNNNIHLGASCKYAVGRKKNRHFFAAYKRDYQYDYRSSGAGIAALRACAKHYV